MRTVRDLAAAVALQADLANGTLDAIRWLGEAYREWCVAIPPAHLRREAELSVAGTITAGTITVAQAGTAVTGNATALAAWSSAIEGRFFRGHTSWYRIARYLGASGFVLEAPFGESSLTAGGYAIVQRFVDLPLDARWVIDVRAQRMGRVLEQMSLEELNRIAPERPEIQSIPTIWCPAPAAPGGYPRLEVYPYPDDAETILVSYYAVPQELDADLRLPANVEETVLMEGALVRAYQRRAAMAGTANQIEAAAFWGNLEQRKRTIWRDLMTEMSMAATVARGATVIRVNRESRPKVSLDTFWRTESST